MKNKLIILTIVFIAIQSSGHLFAAPQKNDSVHVISSTTKIDSSNNSYENTFTWINSPYIALGYGYPQGIRFEIGYNILKYFSLGIIYNFNNYWIESSGNGTWGFNNKMIGLNCRIFLPYKSWYITPYLLISRGLNFSIFGTSNSYTNIYLGTMIPVTKWLQLRPELGIDFTSRYISGGVEFPGYGPNPEVKQDKTWFGFNLSMEFDIIGLFR